MLAILIGAFIAGASKGPPTSKVEPPRAIDVKGTAPGISFADWLRQNADAKNSCETLNESPGHTVKSCALLGDEKCTSIGGKSFCHDQPKFDTFAGQQVLFRYKFHDDSLWEINIIGISPDAFDSVVATMESKYGKAEVTKSDIQNRMGAHFEDGSAVWAGSNGMILYKKYVERLDSYSRLTAYSTDAWKDVEATLKQKSEKAKNDM